MFILSGAGADLLTDVLARGVDLVTLPGEGLPDCIRCGDGLACRCTVEEEDLLLTRGEEGVGRTAGEADEFFRRSMVALRFPGAVCTPLFASLAPDTRLFRSVDRLGAMVLLL